MLNCVMLVEALLVKVLTVKEDIFRLVCFCVVFYVYIRDVVCFSLVSVAFIVQVSFLCKS